MAGSTISGGVGARKVLLAAFLVAAWGVRGAAAADCGPYFPLPERPKYATDLNGVTVPDACFWHEGPHHVFVIGDWGGVGVPPVPADHRSPKFTASARPFVVGVDDSAQHRVAAQMKRRATISNPEYVLNVGDNFYWAGIETRCGQEISKHIDRSNQWGPIYETMYTGPGLDGKQWLGVLGNHDYGGYLFTGGWDQVIGYTWGSAPDTPPASGRWLTPAQYWKTKVKYHDFTVDYFFLDTNIMNVWDHGANAEHNICGSNNNNMSHCENTGPTGQWTCYPWFKQLWEKQVGWMEDALRKTDSTWQIVVTHFPADTFGKEEWQRLTSTHGIDLIITGHEHHQQVSGNHPGNPLAPTVQIVSGGGGGITSEGVPTVSGHDDMYGFMDLTLSKDKIIVEAISHGGVVRSRTEVHEYWRAKQETNNPEEETTSDEPPNPFEALLPDFAKDKDWNPVDGAVDRACDGGVAGGSPPFYTLFGASTILKCKVLCEAVESCKGFEFNLGLSECNLWTERISGWQYLDGSVCLSYREPAPVSTSTTTVTTSTSTTSTTTITITTSRKPLVDMAIDQEPDLSVCHINMTIYNVNYPKLIADGNLGNAFLTAIKTGLMQVAGNLSSNANFKGLGVDSVDLRVVQGEWVNWEVPENGAAYSANGQSNGQSSVSQLTAPAASFEPVAEPAASFAAEEEPEAEFRARRLASSALHPVTATSTTTTSITTTTPFTTSTSTTTAATSTFPTTTTTTADAAPNASVQAGEEPTAVLWARRLASSPRRRRTLHPVTATSTTTTVTTSTATFTTSTSTTTTVTSTSTSTTTFPGRVTLWVSVFVPDNVSFDEVTAALGDAYSVSTSVLNAVQFLYNLTEAIEVVDDQPISIHDFTIETKAKKLLAGPQDHAQNHGSIWVFGLAAVAIVIIGGVVLGLKVSGRLHSRSFSAPAGSALLPQAVCPEAAAPEGNA